MRQRSCVRVSACQKLNVISPLGDRGCPGLAARRRAMVVRGTGRPKAAGGPGVAAPPRGLAGGSGTGGVVAAPAGLGAGGRVAPRAGTAPRAARRRGPRMTPFPGGRGGGKAPPLAVAVAVQGGRRAIAIPRPAWKVARGRARGDGGAAESRGSGQAGSPAGVRRGRAAGRRMRRLSAGGSRSPPRTVDGGRRRGGPGSVVADHQVGRGAGRGVPGLLECSRVPPQ